MWRNKKPDAPQSVDAEPKNLQTQSAVKAGSGVMGGNNQMNKDVIVRCERQQTARLHGLARACM